ncbi:hypothetical protein DEO72_LG6g1165 [Vigna unguiculata]|uniref:Uncharacterized protein n=1 Tax=Vigna unguiculata TaxID=3917 RepID=A0A4D6M597_VIGUN|nr:hypothetical protein DEO72_LG6g1165 [Vigna unguiculata]
MMALRGDRRLCSHGCCVKMKNDGGAAIECARCRDGGGCRYWCVAGNGVMVMQWWPAR